MRKSKYPQVPAQGTPPVAPPPPRKPHKHDGPHEEKPKKKKKKHHSFLWIILIVLLLGILLGLLIDRGIIFPGGEGWFSGRFSKQEENGKGNTPIDVVNATITPNPSPVPTNTIDEKTSTVVELRIKGTLIYMNNYVVDADNLLLQLQTPTYKQSVIYLVDDYASKTVYDNVKTLLENWIKDELIEAKVVEGI